jgi:glyoxylase-like metal-dependent hydrolase (beta-lactamase superfamily II)
MTDFRVYAIRYAEREGQRGQHFCWHDDAAGDPHPTAYYVWLAISKSHVVLVDAGIRPDTAAPIDGLRYVASPVETLAALGIAPTDVGHVVLTHLHYDHTGTATAFPTARYVVQRRELDYWTGPWARRITRERWLVDDQDVAHLMAARVGGRVECVDGDADIVPGLSVHLVGGHTAGMQVVRVRTASGDVVLASDASHFYENIETDRPFPILHSMPDMYGAFDRINELASAPHLVVPGHDPAVLARFEAYSPELADRVVTIA